MRMLAHGLLLACTLAAAGAAADAPLDAAAIGAAAGVEATPAADGVVRVAWPRTDVPVTVGGAALAPRAGLVSSATFTRQPAGALLLAEAVLFEDEVTPAVDAALAQGLAVTGLGGRLLFDRPRVLVLHLEGEGDPVTLASAQKAVWDAVRAVRAQAPKPADHGAGEAPQAGTIDAPALQAALGAPVRLDEGVASATIGRDATLHRARIGAAQGIATQVWFVGSDAHAAATGEIAATASELQAVVRTLRAGGLQLTGLDGHTVGESPVLHYVAFWGSGPARTLASGLRAALEAQRAARR